VDDLISAKEPRSRCGLDDATLTFELRRDVDGPRIIEDDAGEGCIGDDDEDAVEGGGLVV
jgi:hypothetical protein